VSLTQELHSPKVRMMRALGEILMPLNFKFKSKEEFPAEVSNLYVERDGVWLLNVVRFRKRSSVSFAPTMSR
jgi:hypothetical protein